MVKPPACVMEGFEDALHSPEERANHEEYGLVLHPVGYGPTWNGFAQPVVKAEEFAAFVAAHAANDRNGTWGAVFKAADQNGRPVLVHLSTDYEGDSISKDGEVLQCEVAVELDIDDTGIVVDLSVDDWCISAWSPTEGNVYELSGWCFVALPEIEEVLG